MKDIMSFLEYVLLYTFGVQYDCVGCFHSKDTCREKRVVVLDKCMICLDGHDVSAMTQPCPYGCKYHSCETCMAEWLARNPSCPMCRKPMGEGFEREWDSMSYGSYERESDDSESSDSGGFRPGDPWPEECTCGRYQNCPICDPYDFEDYLY